MLWWKGRKKGSWTPPRRVRKYFRPEDQKSPKWLPGPYTGPRAMPSLSLSLWKAPRLCSHSYPTHTEWQPHQPCSLHLKKNPSSTHNDWFSVRSELRQATQSRPSLGTFQMSNQQGGSSCFISSLRILISTALTSTK